MMEVTTAYTVEVVPCLQRELVNVGIAMNARKTVALPPKENEHTHAGIVPLLGDVDVHVADKGGVEVVGVPIGTDAYAMESAMEIIENCGAEQLARIPPRM